MMQKVISLFVFGFCFAACQISDPALPQGFEVFYTTPGEVSGAQKRIVRFIDSAQKKIRMAVYNFDNEEILRALQKAKKRGVDVKIIGDIDEEKTQGYLRLRIAFPEMISGNAYGIAHNKFIVKDSESVLTGTGNFSKSDLFYNDNNFIIINDNDAAAWYESEFFRMFNGTFSTYKQTRFRHKQKYISGVHTEAFFFPTDSDFATQRMVQEIDSAVHSIHYMIFAFSHDEIGSALIRAARRGVRIYGIHDEAFLSGPSQEAPRLLRASKTLPISIRKDGNENFISRKGSRSGAKMHCKTMIIDAGFQNATVLTGSFNWSKNAETVNDENLIIIKNKELAKPYLSQWKLAWKKSQKPEIKTYGSPALYGDIQITEIAYFSGDNDTLQQFIEIQNTSNNIIDLSNWAIAWKDYKEEKFFPLPNPDREETKIILHPKEFFIFYTSKTGPYSANILTGKSLKIPASKKILPNPSNIQITLYDAFMNKIDSTGQLPPAVYLISPSGKIASFTRPYKAWKITGHPCETCASSRFFANPGQRRIYSENVQLHEISEIFNNGVKILITEDIPVCTEKKVYSISGPGSPVIDTVISNGKNELIFNLSGVLPDSVYTISTFVPRQQRILSIALNLPEVYLGTPSGLYYSADGISYTKIPLSSRPLPVNDLHIHKNIVYAATPEGVYYSSAGNFTKDTLSPLQTQKVRANDLYVFVATPKGLFRKEGASYTTILNSNVNSLDVQANRLVTGSLHELFYSQDNGDTFQTYSFFPADVWDVALDAKIWAALSNGVYSSVDGQNFQHAAMPQPNIPRYKISFSSSSTFFVSSGNLYVTEGPDIFVRNLPVFKGKPVFPLSMASSGDTIYLGTSAGLFISSNRGLNYSHPLQFCPNSREIPTGTVSFISPPKMEEALFQLSEVSLHTSPQWLKLLITKSGIAKSVHVTYYGNTGEEFVFTLPEKAYTRNEFVTIIADPFRTSVYQKFSTDVGNIFYSPIPDFSLNDGIMVLKQGNEIVDLLYYSNKDGYIQGALMNSAMKTMYFDINFHKFANFDKYYPISGLNDAAIQQNGIDISGISTQESLQKFGDSWMVAPSTENY